MEHPHLTPHERRIVSETCGRLGAQLLRERVDESRWSSIVLAVVVELAEQVLRLVHDTERPPAPPSHVSGAELEIGAQMLEGGARAVTRIVATGGNGGAGGAGGGGGGGGGAGGGGGGGGGAAGNPGQPGVSSAAVQIGGGGSNELVVVRLGGPPPPHCKCSVKTLRNGVCSHCGLHV